MAEALFDVAVIGGGPAGIAAAAVAAEHRSRVLLLDRGWAVGGQIWRRAPGRVPPAAARRWQRRLAASGATVRVRTTVVDATAGWLLVDGPDGVAEVRAERLVIATGARELFLPFPGWTLPGVFGVAALQAFVESGADCHGRRVVLSGSGPLLLAAAHRLLVHGAEVVLAAEQARPAAVRRFAAGLWRSPGKLALGLRLRAALTGRYRAGCWATTAEGAESVQAVELTDGRRRWTERCDLLGTSWGLVPNTELARLLGCRTVEGRVTVGDDQATSVVGVWAAGEPTGIGGAELALVEGEIAGRAAVGEDGPWPVLQRSRVRLQRFAASLERTFAPRAELRQRLLPDTLVCRCEDVPWSAVDPAWGGRQGKLLARVGMGACQGRVCGPALGFLCGWEEGSVRPPLEPVPVGSLTGCAPPAAPP